MASLNELTLMGNLTRDPELKNPGEKQLCTFGLALNEKYKDAQQKLVETTTFVDVTFFGADAKTAHEYLKKGSLTMLKGKLRTDTWDDKETGKKRSALKVIGTRLILLPNGGGNKSAAAASSEAPSDSSEG